MAREYLERLSRLVGELDLADRISAPLEVRHFFAGAALYVNGKIVATWSPVGLAFKLSEGESEELIRDGRATPLRYFPGGRVKKGYALFERADPGEAEAWKDYFIRAARGG